MKTKHKRVVLRLVPDKISDIYTISKVFINFMAPRAKLDFGIEYIT